MTVDILAVLILTFPLLAAVLLLVLYPLALLAIRRLPAHEYDQASRAPAWLATAVGGGVLLFAMIGLSAIAPGDRTLIGLSGRPVMLVSDPYTLWGSALLGGMLMITAWVPAARRSLVPRTILPFALVLVLAWLALLLVTSVSLPLLLGCWALLMLGALGLWLMLFRPARWWGYLDIPLVLLVSGVLAAIGLGWLQTLLHGAPLTEAGVLLLSESPRHSNSALLLVILGFLGPAAYLPWWIWTRRDEPAMVWLPAALGVATAGLVTLVRVLLLALPSRLLAQLPGIAVDQAPFVGRLLAWLLTWGVLTMLAGTAWLVINLILSRRRPVELAVLRPLALVVLGLWLLLLAAGLRAQGLPDPAAQTRGTWGLLWAQLGWVGVTGLWLSGGAMFAALCPREKTERGLVIFSLAVGILLLTCLPPSPGFYALSTLWTSLAIAGVSPLIPAALLALTGFSTLAFFPRWVAHQSAPHARPGAGWGILAPFLAALGLLACGILAPLLTRTLDTIRLALFGA